MNMDSQQGFAQEEKARIKRWLYERFDEHEKQSRAAAAAKMASIRNKPAVVENESLFVPTEEPSTTAIHEDGKRIIPVTNHDGDQTLLEDGEIPMDIDANSSSTSSPGAPIAVSRGVQDAAVTDKGRAMPPVTQITSANLQNTLAGQRFTTPKTSAGARSVWSGRKMPQTGALRAPKSTLTNIECSTVSENGVMSGATPLQSTNNPATQSTPSNSGLPQWYRQCRIKPLNEPARDKVVALSNFRDLVTKVAKNLTAEGIVEVRHRLHEFEHYAVTEEELKKVRMLDFDRGLALLFSPNSPFPYDLRDDGLALHTKWCSHDFDPEIMRGTETKRGDGGRMSAKFSNDINRKTLNEFGAGDLVNGRWWPSQLCTVRDGAHGHTQGGIYGQQSKGAFSIVISGSQYEDKDNGEEIYYTGTKDKSSNGTVTDATKLMLANIQNAQPVRVLRSHGLPATNRYRPERGFRYDGLYRVVSSEPLDTQMAHHRFRLLRLEGQSPIRSEGEARRPTQQELARWQEARDLIRSREGSG